MSHRVDCTSRMSVTCSTSTCRRMLRTTYTALDVRLVRARMVMPSASPARSSRSRYRRSKATSATRYRPSPSRRSCWQPKSPPLRRANMAIVHVLHAREDTRDRVLAGALLQAAVAPLHLREPGVEVADRFDRRNVPIVTRGARLPVACCGCTTHSADPSNPSRLRRAQNRRAVVHEQTSLWVERLDLPDGLPERLTLLGHPKHV